MSWLRTRRWLLPTLLTLISVRGAIGADLAHSRDVTADEVSLEFHPAVQLARRLEVDADEEHVPERKSSRELALEEPGRPSTLAAVPLMTLPDPVIPFNLVRTGWILLGAGGTTAGIALVMTLWARRRNQSAVPPQQQAARISGDDLLSRLIAGTLSVVEERVEAGDGARLYGTVLATEQWRIDPAAMQDLREAGSSRAAHSGTALYRLSAAVTELRSPHYRNRKSRVVSRDSSPATSVGEGP